jgi:hypothetical protein
MIRILTRYELLLMNDLQNKVQDSKLFPKIDLKGRYNLTKIYTSDKSKTAFCTKYKYYEYLVLLFGIADTLASFQNIINKIIKDIINLVIVTYIYNIVIYSQTKEKHKILIN